MKIRATQFFETKLEIELPISQKVEVELSSELELHLIKPSSMHVHFVPNRNSHSYENGKDSYAKVSAFRGAVWFASMAENSFRRSRCCWLLSYVAVRTSRSSQCLLWLCGCVWCDCGMAAWSFRCAFLARDAFFYHLLRNATEESSVFQGSNQLIFS